jgi:DNA-binding NarL/FixJ family response regulator
MASKAVGVVLNIDSRLVQDLVERNLSDRSNGYKVLQNCSLSDDHRCDSLLFIYDWKRFVDEKMNGKSVLSKGQVVQGFFYLIINVPKGEEETIVEIDDIQRIRGIFYEDDSWEVFEKGFFAVLDGDIWIPRKVLAFWMERKSQNNGERCHETLSCRERAVLRLIVVGLSNKEISHELYISANTVKAHLYNIYKKIEVENRLQAAIWASNNIKILN